MTGGDLRLYPDTPGLRQVYDALVQAQDCIRGETPEDITDAEAREDTIEKVRDAMRTIEAMQACDPDAWMRDDGSAATVNPMIAGGWKAQGGYAVPLYAAPRSVPPAQGSGDCGEIARLRKGIQDYLDGNYENARKHRGEDPHYRCGHGQHYWEDCSQCVDAHFSRLLGETYTLSSTESK